MMPAQSPIPKMPLASPPDTQLSATSPNLLDGATQEMLLVPTIRGSRISECSSYASLLRHRNIPQEEAVWKKGGFKAILNEYKFNTNGKSYSDSCNLPHYVGVCPAYLGLYLVCSVPQCNLVSVEIIEKSDNIQCSKKIKTYMQIYTGIFIPRTKHLWDISYI